MAYTVQCDYDQLNGIVQRFNDASESARNTYDKVSAQMEVLRGGAWIGPNADKFYEIMDNDWLPAMDRLTKSMEKAAEPSTRYRRSSRMPTTRTSRTSPPNSSRYPEHLIL